MIEIVVGMERPQTRLSVFGFCRHRLQDHLKLRGLIQWFSAPKSKRSEQMETLNILMHIVLKDATYWVCIFPVFFGPLQGRLWRNLINYSTTKNISKDKVLRYWSIILMNLFERYPSIVIVSIQHWKT